MKKSSPSAAYDVGYGKPPAHSRFQRGQSGNPKGRPKGALNVVTVLNRTLSEKVVVVEHGKRRSITKLEAAFKQLVNKAAQGDARSLQQLLSLNALIGAETPRAMTTLDQDETAVLQGLLARLAPDSSDIPSSQSSPETSL